MLGGFVAVLDLPQAAKLFELPKDQVNRFDLKLKPGYDAEEVRKKIEQDPDHPRLIKTIRGVGYVFTGYAERQASPRR